MLLLCVVVVVDCCLRLVCRLSLFVDFVFFGDCNHVLFILYCLVFLCVVCCLCCSLLLLFCCVFVVAACCCLFSCSCLLFLWLVFVV